MTTLKHSGYLASESAIVFSGTQQLNSLTDNEYTDLSDEIDNNAGGTGVKYFSVDLRAVIASAAFTGSDSGIEIYLIRSADGTNYPTWTGNTSTDRPENAAFRVGFIPFTGATAAQAGILEDVELPPGKYKWAVRNRGNVTLAGSGNTIYWRPHSYDQA